MAGSEGATVSAFERVWFEVARFQAFSGVETAWCPVSRPFVQWCANLVTEAGTQPTVVKVKSAKFLLTDRYFHFRASVGRNHKDVTRTHPCLYQAFVETWEILNELELALVPLELLPVPETGPRQVAGILLGEES